MVQTRFLSLGTMTHYDLAAIRFAFAAFFLFPVLLKRGLMLGSFGRGLALTASLGAPYMLVVGYGMRLAPASHGAAIINGTMVTVSALVSWLLLKERTSLYRAAGVLLILAGLTLLLHSRAVGGLNLGHLLFVVGGISWGIYGLLAKRWKVDPIHATAVVGFYSAIFYLPIYLVFLKPSLSTVPASALLLHGIYQGGFASGLALFFFSVGVTRLGAAGASLYMPLVPVITMALAAALLHEFPTRGELMATAVIISGLVVAALHRVPVTAAVIPIPCPKPNEPKLYAGAKSQ